MLLQNDVTTTYFTWIESTWIYNKAQYSNTL